MSSKIRESFNQILAESKVLTELNRVDDTAPKFIITNIDEFNKFAENFATLFPNKTPEEITKSLTFLHNSGVIGFNNEANADKILSALAGVIVADKSQTTAPEAKEEPKAKKNDFIPYGSGHTMANVMRNRALNRGDSKEQETKILKSKAIKNFMTDEEKKKQMDKIIHPFDSLNPWEKLAYMVQKDKTKQYESKED